LELFTPAKVISISMLGPAIALIIGTDHQTTNTRTVAGHLKPNLLKEPRRFSRVPGV
jgi:hypothetical protein